MSEPPRSAAPGPEAGLPDDIVRTVRRVVAESLAIDEAEVALESRFIDDLGADSLDFVDVVFMLETELDVKLRDSELSFLTKLDFASPEVMREGHLTAPVVEQLSGWLPALEDPAAVTPAQLFSSITVEAICLAASRQRGA